ncbi:helix-turn-helix transcriptional regulator [Cupriavidus nantongensis]|uniref:LexA family transcriptional regulator n=1 Tax=Cupriavidus nantongensis TaxID=1796606 RepID=UPI00358EB371
MLTGDKLGAAIEQARLKKGVSKKALADAMGVKPASVQDWVKYGRIAKERINDLVAYFSDVVGPEHWGLDFPGAVKSSTSPSSPRQQSMPPSSAGAYNPSLGPADQDLPHPSEEEFALVPQLDVMAACGDGRFQDHVVVKGGLAFKRSSLREFGVPEHAARVIYADGGSMRPTIQDGRVVLINTADTEPKDGKVYAICMPDGGLLLKRLVLDYHPGTGGMAWIIRSDNPDRVAFPDKLLPPDDRTMIAGRAVWTDSLL